MFTFWKEYRKREVEEEKVERGRREVEESQRAQEINYSQFLNLWRLIFSLETNSNQESNRLKRF